jgi:hypothetical protein
MTPQIEHPRWSILGTVIVNRLTYIQSSAIKIFFLSNYEMVIPLSRFPQIVAYMDQIKRFNASDGIFKLSFFFSWYKLTVSTDIILSNNNIIRESFIILKRLLDIYKNSLKTPKGLSESVNRRRTDNIMAKRKRTKRQATIYKTLHRKLTIEQYEPIVPPVVSILQSGPPTVCCR